MIYKIHAYIKTLSFVQLMYIFKKINIYERDNK